MGSRAQVVLTLLLILCLEAVNPQWVEAEMGNEERGNVSFFITAAALRSPLADDGWSMAGI